MSKETADLTRRLTFSVAEEECGVSVMTAAPQLGRSRPPLASPDARPPAVDKYLPPGQLLACWHPTHISTILGSCVGVCLWDATLGVGGLNHFLLPRGSTPSSATAPRFGNLAVPRLIEAVLAFGCRRDQLQAKVFGGACVLDAFRNGSRGLGAQNVDVALEILDKERIPVIAKDVGGDRGRKLVFGTYDGSAWVRTL